MKLELSINVKYLPEWGVWEGVRELVQNGKDAETEFSAALKVTHQNQTLRIENEGAELPHEALLFGTTTKAERGDLIGKFGEGLKLGVLALVRGGRPVKIRSGGEVWLPTIAKSEKFKADVLVFDIKGGNEPKKRVRVEIGGVTEVEWCDLRERFLFLATLKKDEKVETTYGWLLMGDRFKGKIYVKGIFVQHDSKLNYGYNFTDATVDRDRKMVASWEISWKTGQIWRDAVGRRPDLFDAFYTLVEEGKDDVQGIDENTHVPDEIAQKAAQKFREKFGNSAVPVANLAESAEVEHLGAKGVVVPKSMGQILAKAVGNGEAVRQKLREEVVKMFSWGDLVPERQTNIQEAIELLAAVYEPCKLERIDVVEFRSGSLAGQYKDSRILLAARITDDPDETLRVLVHEFAHEFGKDGEKGHVNAIESLWRGIVKHLRARKS
jgi:hypothetical protein